MVNEKDKKSVFTLNKSFLIPSGPFTNEGNSHYIVVALKSDLLLQTSVLKKLFNSFEDQDFKILLLDEDQFKFNEKKILDFHKEFSSSNNYNYTFNASKSELLKLVINSKGVITDSNFYSNLANYHLVESIYIGEEHSPCKFLKVKSRSLKVLENGLNEFREDENSNFMISFTELADLLYDIWNLIKKEPQDEAP